MTVDAPTDSSSPPQSRRTRLLVIVLVLAAVAAAIVYFVVLPSLSNTTGFGPSPDLTPGGKNFTFNGSGATFPQPFYAKLFAEYNRLRPLVKINYNPTGSDVGIAQISQHATDFGASDVPMTDAQLKAAKGEVLHIAMTLGAVVPVYHLPGVPGDKPVVFSGAVLADIMRGKITRWNDPALTALNIGLAMPDTEITIVHRADGSGTTYVFSEYLSKVNADFAKAPGKGTMVNWPAAKKLAASGNEGVVQTVSKTPGAIGYAELTYAMQHKIAYGDVVNAAGKAIHASLRSLTEAAESQKRPLTDLRMSITNAEGETAYPIAAYTYLLVYKDSADKDKANALADFLVWAVTDGQKLAPDVSYAPLPTDVAALDQRLILTLTSQGKPLTKGK